jgi:competence protein ComFC
VLDYHTSSSVYLGEDAFGHAKFDNVRTDVGDLVYRLKYCGEVEAAERLGETAARFLASVKLPVGVIVPVPASKARAIQPVRLLAARISAYLGIPMMDCVVRKPGGTELKNVDDVEERAGLLRGTFGMVPGALNGRGVLLIDDLYRSGATMNSVAAIITKIGGAREVYAFAFTRTRSNR